MAVVVIKKGSKRLRVSRGAYENLYKRAGWKIDSESAGVTKRDAKTDEGAGRTAPDSGQSGGKEDNQKEDKTEEAAKEQEKDAWDEADEELAQEANVDSMDLNELKKLAASKGINTKGMTVGALKKAIKEAM